MCAHAGARRKRLGRERRRGGAHRPRRNRARRERRGGWAHLWRGRARRRRAWRHGRELRERRRELDWRRWVEVRVEKERGRGRRWSELLRAEQLTAQQARLRAGQRLTWRAPCRGAEGRRRRQLVAVDEVAPATVRALAAGEVLTHDGLVPASRRGAVRPRFRGTWQACGILGGAAHLAGRQRTRSSCSP